MAGGRHAYLSVPRRALAAARADGQPPGSHGCRGGDSANKPLQPFAAGLSMQTSNSRRGGSLQSRHSVLLYGSVTGREPVPSPRAGVAVGYPGLLHPKAGDREKTPQSLR